MICQISWRACPARLPAGDASCVEKAKAAVEETVLQAAKFEEKRQASKRALLPAQEPC